MNEQNKSDSEILSKLAFASLNEQRRARRWSIFFKGLMAVYFFVLLFMIYIPASISYDLRIRVLIFRQYQSI